MLCLSVLATVLLDMFELCLMLLSVLLGEKKDLVVAEATVSMLISWYGGIGLMPSEFSISKLFVARMLC
jgi:hypothetical protein